MNYICIVLVQDEAIHETRVGSLASFLRPTSSTSSDAIGSPPPPQAARQCITVAVAPAIVLTQILGDDMKTHLNDSL